MPPWYNDKELQASQVWFQPTAGPGYKGNWNHVEAYFQINSIAGGIGQADGVMQYWFNGTLVFDRHDILFRTGARPSINFHQFLIAPYIGDGSPADQYMWVDNLTVATGAPSAPSGSVASVTVSPSSMSVAAGSTYQFTATLKDAFGTVLTGQPVTWATSDPSVATVNGSGLVTGAVAGTATISATSCGVTDTATVTVASPVTNPGTVADLAVTGVMDSSVTLAFTEVTDGTGLPASYDVRWAAGALTWSAAPAVAQGSCKVLLAGTVIGARRSCTVLGLAAAKAYQFQLVAFRGTLNVNAVFGGLSHIAAGSTLADPPGVPVASVTLST